MHLWTHTQHQHDHNAGAATVAEALQSEIRQALHEWRTHMPPRLELFDSVDPSHDHICGEPAASVILVEYGCLGSRGEAREDRAVRSKIHAWLDAGQISLVFRHFPLLDSHPGAWEAALALEAADRQDGFWRMYEALTDVQTSPWATELDLRAILAVARHEKLDIGRLKADMEDHSIATKIVRDLDSGFRSGVNGAPTFYLQGIRQDIDGPDELADRVEHALAGDLAALWPPEHQLI